MKLNVHNLVRWFQSNYPDIVRDMKECSHHYDDQDELNGYHIEGDVWTHNCMVVNQCRESNNCNLLVAALLHDIGKPRARKENPEKKRVHFWGHEPWSMFMATPIIDHINSDFDCYIRKQLVLEAISMHTDVYNVPREELANRLAGKHDLAQLLSDLSTADYNGRFYDNGERDMEPIKWMDKKSVTIDDITKKPQLICMIGLPCSGKSSIVLSKPEIMSGYVILSRDLIVREIGKELNLSTYNEAYNKCNQDEVNTRFQARRKLLTNKGVNVILDMTNMGRKARRRNMQGFDKYNKTAEVVMTSMVNIYQRNAERVGKYISPSVITRMVTSFQPPLYDEFSTINWRFN